jgi:ATP phosphoribosyltransferase regulatory subunit
VSDEAARADIHRALASKDASALAQASAGLAPAVRQSLLALVQLYGDATVLDEAENPAALARRARRAIGLEVAGGAPGGRAHRLRPGRRARLGLLQRHAFSVYAKGAGDALLRGGRYDGVGAVFGHKRDRDRPAVGFSLDLKQLVRAVPPPLRAAIRAPWGDAPGLAAAVPRCAAKARRWSRAAGRGRRAGRISLRPRAGAAWRALGRGAL